MRASHVTATGYAAVITVLVAGLAAGGGVAPAAAADTTACTVSEARAVWVAGSDDLEASGSAASTDGQLTLDGGTGVLDPLGPTGSISFEGEIGYTSAAGVPTTLTNPTIVVDGKSGILLFDVQPEGTDLIPQEPLVTVDLRAGAVSEEGDAVTLDALEAATDASAGAEVLWSGVPGSLDLTVAAECPTAETPTGGPASPEADDGSGMWLAVTAVGIAAALAALLAVGSVQRRKRNSASVDSGAVDVPPGDAAP